MKLTKVTVGFVTQSYDTETGKWTDQEFIAGNSTWEDNESDFISPPEFEGKEPYLPFEMEKPDEQLTTEEKVIFGNLLDAYVERATDDLDTDCLGQIASDYVREHCEQMSLSQLRTQVESLYPELLEE